jgi:Integrase core domain
MDPTATPRGLSPRRAHAVRPPRPRHDFRRGVRLGGRGLRPHRRPHGTALALAKPYVERVIGSIRGECLEHVIVFTERHLRRVLRTYVAYYQRSRTHLALGKDAPVARAVQPTGRIVVRPEAGGAVDLRRRTRDCPRRVEQRALGLSLQGPGPAPCSGLTTNSRRTGVRPEQTPHFIAIRLYATRAIGARATCLAETPTLFWRTTASKDLWPSMRHYSRRALALWLTGRKQADGSTFAKKARHRLERTTVSRRCEHEAKLMVASQTIR